MSKIRGFQIWISMITSLLLLIVGITGMYLGVSSTSFSNHQFGNRQDFNFNRGNGMPNFGSDQGNTTQGDGSGDSGQTNNGGSSSDSHSNNNSAMPNGNMVNGLADRMQGVNSFHMKITQFIQGTYNGKDVRWLMDLISGILILLSLAGGFTGIQTLRDKNKEEAL